MNILITGSGGFIGSHLSRGFITRGYRVFTPRSTQLDLTDYAAVKTFLDTHSVDVIVHCATIGGSRGVQDPEDTVEKNVQMLRNLISGKSDGCRIITFGSGAMYGRQRSLKRVKEAELGEVIPEDRYGLSKLKISEICRDRTDCLCLNIFACYGVGEKSSRFSSYAIRQVLNNEDIVISHNCSFDYLYIYDLIAIVDLFMHCPPVHKVINVTPDESFELLTIAKTAALLRPDYTGRITVVNTTAPDYTGDNQLLREELDVLAKKIIGQDEKQLYDRFLKQGRFCFTPLSTGLIRLYESLRHDIFAGTPSSEQVTAAPLSQKAQGVSQL